MGKYVYGTLYPLLCRTDLIFGNLEEIWEFHADTLLPQLESCHLNPTLIAKTFLEYCQHLTRMYCRSVVNQEYLTVGLLSAVCYRLFSRLETAHLYRLICSIYLVTFCTFLPALPRY